MKTSISRFLLAIALQAVLFGSTIASAQVDPTKVLVGVWEGTVAVNHDNERVIVIKSVKPKEDGSGWTAEGQYGLTRDRLGKMTYNVSMQGNDIIVEFVVARTSNPGRLKLVGDKKLDGQMNFVGDAGKKVNRSMTLEKVESPPLDVAGSGN